VTLLKETYSAKNFIRGDYCRTLKLVSKLGLYDKKNWLYS